MAVLNIYSDIVDEKDKVFLRDCMGLDGVCFKDIKDFIASIPEDDKNIDIRINCAGGDCIEGWAIYDSLRSSGKEISVTIEGQCSSMATVILMAAPLERRIAYKNAHICIHNPEACYIDVDYYTRNTADNIDAMAEKLRAQAETLRMEQNKILDLYVDRTGADREILQELMNQDIYINTDRAKELGLISTIIAPNTAIKNKTNNKNREMKGEVKVKSDVLNWLLAKCGLKKVEDIKMVAQTVTAANGDQFTVEREEGDPQVGDAASPDGEYVMDDGTKIEVEDGFITSINAPDEESGLTDPDTGNPMTEEEAQEKLDEQRGRIIELEEELNAAKSAKDDAEKKAMTDEERQILDRVAKAGGKDWLDKISKMKSTFTPANRSFVERKPSDKEDATYSSSSYKAKAEERFKAMKKKIEK